MAYRALVTTASVLFIACSSATPPNEAPPCQKVTCGDKGMNCGTVSDGCGGTLTCGTCTAPETCQVNNVCACKPETDLEMCRRLGASCGDVTAFDNCGASRHIVSCGECSAPETCGAGAPNVCGCTSALSDRDLCVQRLGLGCGAAVLVDDCGRERHVDCGTCTSPKTCGGGGQANVCGCPHIEADAELCIALGNDCGQLSVFDSCGEVRRPDCGTCASGLRCGDVGLPNVCGGFLRDTTFPTDAEPRAFWGSGANDVWAVATSVAAGQGTRHLLHHDGQAWTEKASEPGVDVGRIGGDAADNVIFASIDGGVKRWNGTGFITLGTNPFAVEDDEVRQIAVIGRDNIWIGTRDGAVFHHWNGSSWTSDTGAQALMTDHRARGIWAAPSHALWASGADHLARFDGSSWTLVPTSPGGRLVIGSTESNIYVIGYDGLYHYDGTSWQNFTPLLYVDPASWLHPFMNGDELWYGSRRIRGTAVNVVGTSVGSSSLAIGVGSVVWFAGPGILNGSGNYESAVYRSRP